MEKRKQVPSEYGIIGNLTKDQIITNSEVLNRIGGSAYFVSNTLLDLGNHVKLHTNADSIPIELLKKGVMRSGNESQLVTVTIDEAKQKAEVDYPGERIVFSQIPPSYFTVDCTVLATTLGEVIPDDVRKIRNKQDHIVAADIQGFLRVFDDQTHGVVKQEIDLEAFRGFDIIKMNHTEVAVQFPGLSFDAAAEELKRLGINICLFTLGSEGSVVYGNEKYEIPSFPVSPTHTVGAGDTFFASFLNSYMRGKDISSSATEASLYTSKYLQEDCL